MSTGRFPLLGREHRAPAGLRAPWRPWREDATPSLPPGLQSREHPLPAGVPSRARGESQLRGGASGPPAPNDTLEDLHGNDPGQCGWAWRGWAIPLLEPAENVQLYDGCGIVASEELYCHGVTASTFTLPLDGGASYRLYVQNMSVAGDATGVPGLPAYNPADAAQLLERLSASWAASGRFSADYIGFVDSSDPLVFPIYAPLYEATGGCAAPIADGMAGAYAAAGWTATAIPCRSTTIVADGVYCAYRDPTVIDLRDYVGSDMGWVLMVVVEAQSAFPVQDTGAYHPFTEGPIDAWHTSEFRNPSTRVVCYLSADPDFSAPGTIPPPGVPSSAFVLLEPGTGKPGTGRTELAEWYGVPTASISPDGNSLVLMVPWASNHRDGKVPRRVGRRYYDEPGRRPAWYEGRSREGNGRTTGVSVFVVSLTDLVTVLAELWVPWRVSGDTTYSELSRDELKDLVAAGYQGELLVTSGNIDDDGEIASILPIDPHILVCNDVLWLYFDHGEAGVDGAPPTQPWLDRAWPVPSGRWLEHGIVQEVADRLGPQGDYTVFIRDTCEHIVDTAAVGLATSPVRDPDVALWVGRTWTAARFSTTIDTGGAQVDGLVVISTSEQCPSMYTIVPE